MYSHGHRNRTPIARWGLPSGKPWTLCSLLGAAALVLRTRVEHEAAACLVLMIGVVLQLDLQWPLRLPEVFWWGAFTAELGSYLVVRRHVCDRNRQESNQ